MSPRVRRSVTQTPSEATTWMGSSVRCGEAGRNRSLRCDHALSRDEWCGATSKRSSPTVPSGAANERRRASPAPGCQRRATRDGDALNRLHLVQERLDLDRELAGAEGDGTDLDELETAFVAVVAAYGDRKGLTYEAWRSVGVEPRVLKAAGIGR